MARTLPLGEGMILGVFDVARPGTWLRVFSAAGAFLAAAVAVAHARVRRRAYGERSRAVGAGEARWAGGCGLVACGIWGWTLGWPVALYLSLCCLGLALLAWALLRAVAEPEP